MARSTSCEMSNEARSKWPPTGFGPEDGDEARPVPMLLLALLVREREETLRLRLERTLSSGLQVDDEIELPRPVTPSH
jgi:hypothetical protein